METYEDDDDTHFCIKCHVTINGLDNYVRHRQSGCRPPEAKQEAVPEPPTTPTTVTYPEILNADAFFSSLELQSSAKSNPTRQSRSLTDKERKTSKSDDKKKKVRRGQEPEEGGGKEKLLNMPPVVTDLDDLMDNLAIPSLVGFPEIVTTTGNKTSAVGPGKSASTASSSKVNNDENLRDSPLESLMTNSKSSSDRKRTTDSQRIDQDHEEWLEDTSLTDIDANSENKEAENAQLRVYTEYDYRQDEESDDDSLGEENADEESFTDDDDPDDREFPDQRHTGGKWKPSELLQDIGRLNDDELDQDDDNNQENPPVTQTGGKWKPTDNSQLQRGEAEDEVAAGTDSGASSLTPSATSRQQPPPGHTRGKWIPGAASDLGSGYWCDPCGRKLASRLLYNRHLLSSLHARRSIQEIDGDLQLPSGVAPLLQRKSASKRRRALAEIKSVLKPEETKKASKKKSRRREKEVLCCEMCHARVRRPQMGKHLLSHYHCRVAGANPCSSPAARRFILENMGNVVRQCPFQCASCRFYCNTEETFLLHWRSKLHATRFEDNGGNYKCTACNVWCIDNEKMEHHLQSSGHREVVAMMNGSVPVVVRRQRSLVCETCNQRFRYNVQLRSHVRETGHHGSLTATDEYQSKIACNLCSQVFRSLVALQRHRLSCHGSEKDEEAQVVIQPSSPYFCSFCTLNFTTSREAILHRRTIKHKETVKAQKLPADNVGSLGRECPHCNAKHDSLINHKKHLLERHPELCHRCPKCGKLFAISQDVTRHTKNDVCAGKTIEENEDKVTSDDGQWRCRTCPFVTESEAEFVFHKALHAGSIDVNPDEPGTSKALAKYQCPMCEKSLPKNSLRDHIRGHTGERPFRCTKCDATFSRRSGLHAHRKECLPSSTSSLSGRKGSECMRQRNHTCSECNTSFYTNRLAQRLISYQETYTKGRLFWKRRATRINYRWETYIEAVVMYECCSGYAPSANLMQFPTILAASRACTPICPSGCANGKCISPWTCDCDSGYVPTVTKRACIPHCTGDGPDGCGSHGSCLAPDKCICDKGYTFTVTRVNGKSTSGIPCIPECKLGCGKNAFCMSPNNCTCNIGYTRMNTGNWTGLNFDCEPACVPKCESNMNCFAPNRCQCDTGYVPESVHVTTGSGERPVSCSPVCHPPCQNGVCTRPGYCTCLPGYMKTSTGWQHECSPICNPPCINGSCTEPNNCECNSGYRKNAETPHVCLAHCDPPCINGTCTKPGHCECNKGYTKNSSSEICSPVCSPECQANAFCHAPNKCLCNPGYEVTNKEPHLDSTLKPFRINDTSTSNLIETSCKPVCETDCRENESCVAPNTCKCNPGYRLEAVEGNLDRCLPICEPSCVNAYCGQPDKCVCLPGYEPSHDNAFACNPVCQNDCVNATCTRPDYCECHDGYEKAPTSIGSGDLEENHENSCVPSCPEQCLDGTCIAPGQCVCEPGYVLKSTFLLHATSTEMSTTDYHANGNVTTGTNETRVQFCQPLCEPACPIGLECLSPNECEREPDVRANFTETMINSTRVINSIEDCGRNVDFLDENGKCVCRYGWKGLQCEKASLCGLVIRESFGDDEEFTTLQSTTVVNNDTMESTYDDSSDMRMISNDEDSGVLIDWEGPMCNEVCRIMTSSEISGNRSDDAVKCYLLESENVTTGVFSIRSQVLLPGSRNGTFVCFIGIDSMCNVPDSVMIGGPVDSLMGIIIGTIILLLLVVAAGFAIYYRKNRAISEDANQSMSNAAILTNTELIPLYDAEESTFI